MSEPADGAPLTYHETPPGANTPPVVSAYWRFDVHALPHPDFVHRVWPDGCVSVLAVCVQIGGVWRVVATVVRGVTRAPQDVPVQAGTRYVGIRFRAESGAAVLGVPVSSLRDVSLPLAEVVGGHAASQAHAELLARQVTAALTQGDSAVHAAFDAWVSLQTAAVLERAAAQPSPAKYTQAGHVLVDDVVARAVDHLVASGGQVSMMDVAASAGVSLRTLQRRFVSAVGLTPKQFAQVRRARAMLRRTVDESLDERVGWSGVAAESGYADQAHLVREVRQYTQLSPTALKAWLAQITHELVE